MAIGYPRLAIRSPRSRRRLGGRLLTQLDEAKPRDMYQEMQRIVNDEGGVLVPMLLNNIWAKSNRVQHGEGMSSAWEMDGLRLISRWWMDA